MENKQLYVIGIVAVLVAASIGVFFIMSGDDNDSGSFIDAAGNEIMIPDNVESITAASPSIADIVCYMGYGSKIVAVSTSCTHPDIPAGTPTVGGYSSPSTDGISTANATVTFIDGSGNNAKAAYNTLREAGMLVVMMYGSTDTVNGIYNNVEIVGKIMKNSDYEELISDLKDEVELLRVATENGAQTNIMITTGLGNLAIDSSGNFSNLDAWTGAGVYAAGIDAALNSMAASISRMNTPLSGSGWVQLDTDYISTSTGNVNTLIVLWTNKVAMPTDAAVAALLAKMSTMPDWGNCGVIDTENIMFIGGDVGSDLSRVTPYTVYNGLPILSLYINPGCYSMTNGGVALTFADLPSFVDETNMATLVGYTNNKPAA
jgi:ABC-type hemin transport system, periplasmic component